jgi:hypothetical protein
MKQNARSSLARRLAAVALVVLYGIGFLGVSSFSGARQAQARRGGRGGHGFRGFRGARRGVFIGAPLAYYGYNYGYDDRCYWSPRRGSWICPYSYRPYRYYW